VTANAIPDAFDPGNDAAGGEAANVDAEMRDMEGEVLSELLTRLTDKWWMAVLDVLEQAGGPVRFSEVRRRVESITPRSLTRTLRELERDGLLTRQIHVEVPVRVEYTVTALGLELLGQVRPVWLWITDHAGAFVASRARFEAKAAK
jgi:DNA-binding HxlR family transcriptional regulator